VGERSIVRSPHEQPLSNLYFLRDQQAVCGDQVIPGKMAKPQRARETEVTHLFREAAGIPVLPEIGGAGTFEGGDFMLMKNFALIGIGDRTNREGALRHQSCLSGMDEVGLVHQPVHPLLCEQNDPMVAMHLYTYFNVASSGTVIGSELLMQRARVEVYHREGDGFKRADASARSGCISWGKASTSST
jgi:arginine deiminase